MATLAELQSARDTLIRRLTSLRSRVTAGDRTVEYDLSQAEKALKIIDAEIRAASGAPRVSVIRISSSKGL